MVWYSGEVGYPAGIETQLSTINSQLSTTYDLTGRVLSPRALSMPHGIFLQKGRKLIR